MPLCQEIQLCLGCIALVAHKPSHQSFTFHCQQNAPTNSLPCHQSFSGLHRIRPEFADILNDSTLGTQCFLGLSAQWPIAWHRHPDDMQKACEEAVWSVCCNESNESMALTCWNCSVQVLACRERVLWTAGIEPRGRRHCCVAIGNCTGDERRKFIFIFFREFDYIPIIPDKSCFKVNFIALEKLFIYR